MTDRFNFKYRAKTIAVIALVTLAGMGFGNIVAKLAMVLAS